jgi:hypothetical protein
MAAITTHLIFSGPEMEGEEAARHSLFEDVQFDDVQVLKSSSDQQPGLKMIHKSPLEEEAVDFSRLARQASEVFPTATVLVMNVEERFDQVERVQTRLYIGGKNAGEVEHGYVFNIGGD